MTRKNFTSVIAGAAFLMATSAVGPGFLTQTAVFTVQLGASFGFVILLSILLDVIAQLNIWRVLTVSGKRAQVLANETVAGSGYVLAGLVSIGGLIFNVGNIAGTGLGINVLFGVPVEIGALISAAIAIGLFVFKEAGRAMDGFVKFLGIVMVLVIFYVVVVSHPPLAEASIKSVFPDKIDARAIVTLVGGTVGGYITFAGAHRLIDAGVSGIGALPQVKQGAMTGIALTGVIRILLFLTSLGVISQGFVVDSANPPASVFENAAGLIGYKFFGIVMWAAAITSVVGAAFTSVSFIKTFHQDLEKKSNYLIIAFIVVSTLIFLTIGRPVAVLVWAGTVNGFILPVGLALILVSSRRTSLLGDYRHPKWLTAAGWGVVLIMTSFSILTLIESVSN
ncbi:MAG: NRAMP family divalent metal transporter [Acidobacteriota bacterium]